MKRSLRHLARSILSLVLTSSVVVFASPAVPAREADPTSPSWSEAKVADLPALESDAPPQQVPVIPEGDRSDLPGRSTKPHVSFDPKRSTRLDAETTETSEVFENPDGTRTVVMTEKPTRVRDEAGRWQDIDLTLAPGRGGRLSPNVADGAPTLAATAEGDLVTLATPAGDIVVTHPSAKGVPGVASGAEMVYVDALPGGRDLIETVLVDGVKESVVLKAPGAPAAYQVELRLPSGLSARNGGAGVELVDRNGAVVATYSGGIAHDSAPTKTAKGAETTVTASLVDQRGRVATVEVGVDAGWLADPDRAFPVVIDPYLTSNQGSGTFVQTGLGAQGASSEFRVGTPDGGTTVARSLLKFQVYDLAMVYSVVEAHVSLYNATSASCTPTGVDLSGARSEFTGATTWADQPGPDAQGRVSRTTFALGSSGCAAGWVDLDATELVNRWMFHGEANYGLELRATNEADPTSWKTFTGPPYLSVTYERLQPTYPARGSAIGTTTPTLRGGVSEAAEAYLFRVATGRDAETGAVVSSGWQASTTWTVPAGVLDDGVTYYWHTWTRSAATGPVRPYWTSSFRVDLRQGERKAMPFDTVGPVKVNLASGNALVGIATPTFSTVGGTVGLGLTYNSNAPSRGGLVGSYYADDNANLKIDSTEKPAVVRRDTQVAFDWGNASGHPQALPQDHLITTWTGYVTVPVAGTYYFGASVATDDGVSIVVKGTTVLSSWYSQGAATPAYNKGISLSANQRVAVSISHADATGPSAMTLWVKGPVAEAIVPPSWLSRSNDPLPTGWGLTADLDGSFTRAVVAESSVTVFDDSGVAHVFASTGSGFASPPGENATLAWDDEGLLTLHGDDGVVYVFDASGNVASAVSAVDDRSPARPVYTYSGTPTRLRSVKDPVSGRVMNVRYGGDAGCPTSVPAGFDSAAPTGMLCSVEFWDATSTKFFYVSGQLGRVENPGAEIADFAYSSGRLSQIRASNAADAIAAGLRADDATARTAIAYDSAGRVASVTLPAPTAGALRPAHSYTYTMCTSYSYPVCPADIQQVGRAEVVVAGLGAAPSPWARRVDLDATGHVVYDYASPLYASATINEWGPGDRLLSTTDPDGYKTTYHYGQNPGSYDYAKPIAEYGPYVQSAADPNGNGQQPTFDANGYPTSLAWYSMPATQNAYDEGIKGLAAAYWSNTSLRGAPFVHATGVGEPTGALARDWGAGVPEPGLTPGSWSARYTGHISLGPIATRLSLRLALNGYARVYIDGKLVVDAWNDHSGFSGAGYVSVLGTNEPGWRSIRVDYRPGATGARVELQYRVDAVAGDYYSPFYSQVGIWQPVLGSSLRPGYELQTSSRQQRNAPGEWTAPPFITSTGYLSGHTGLPTASTIDPGGLNFTTSTAYEGADATHFRRRISRTLPGGNTTTYRYYGTDGAPASAANPCVSGSASVHQGGALWKTTGPDPDAGGPRRPGSTRRSTTQPAVSSPRASARGRGPASPTTRAGG